MQFNIGKAGLQSAAEEFMKIFYVNPPIYDRLTAVLIEGLNELGHEVWCSEESNYGRAVAEPALRDYAEAADLIVVGSGRGVRTHLLQGVENPKLVFVDGSEYQKLSPTGGIRYQAVFKRELCPLSAAAKVDGVLPLPLAAERRYFTSPTIEKNILVSFIANMDTNPLRYSIHERLYSKGNPLILTGSTGEPAKNSVPGGLPLDTPAYRTLLARSLISVNVPGASYDCPRYWEIPAAGALLFTYRPDVAIPDNFADGVNCVMFGSLEEFNDKLEYYTTHLEVAGKLAVRGYQHVLEHHTSACRAAYFLRHARAAVAQPEYCTSLLPPEIRQGANAGVAL